MREQTVHVRRATPSIVVAATAVLGAFVYSRALPSTTARHVDHLGFRGTAARMRSGEWFYSAYVDSFRDLDVDLGQIRGFRAPTIFLVWRWIPDELLYATYLVAIVGLTALLFSRAVPNRPVAGLVGVVPLVLVARYLYEPHYEAWMLCEAWALPALAGAVLAWSRRRDGVAAALLTMAVLIREIAGLALIGAVVLALRERRPVRPWLAGVVTVAAAWAVHAAIASRYVSDESNVAPLAGTAHFPESVLRMMSWNAPEPAYLVALVTFGAAVIALSRYPELSLAGPMLTIPLLGLVVDRPYWGILAVPVAWWLTAVLVHDLVSEVRARPRGDPALGATSSDATSP
jgi:hypothetical protein